MVLKLSKSEVRVRVIDNGKITMKVSRVGRLICLCRLDPDIRCVIAELEIIHDLEIIIHDWVFNIGKMG